ncbi:MAG: diphthine--ammonia ligase [Peptostreptococcaceae bacterium]
MKDGIKNLKNKKFVTSYSGGKDSTLALYKSMKEGTVVGILVMLEKDGKKSRAHSIPTDLIEAQAKSMGVNLVMASASWETYEEIFVQNLLQIKEEGAEVLITGDIDMPEHGCWYENIANKVGLDLSMPLWRRNHKDVVKEFIELGFITKVVTIDLSQGMVEEDLGKILTLEYMEELESRGIDSCGENGEFHTTVIDGPIFKDKVKVKHGDITKDDKYMYLELKLDK